MIGIDEVGRGAWAGPLLVMAARLKPGKKLPKGLKDSKQLTPAKRSQLTELLISVCDFGDGWVSAEMIDELGLARALRDATILAVMKLDAQTDEHIMIDGNVNLLDATQYRHVETRRKADETVPVVSAASIVAKVLRDGVMTEHAHQYPLYGFDAHVGYGTKRHREALDQYGVTMLHRRSFKPVKALL